MLFLAPNNRVGPIQTEAAEGLFKVDGDPWYIDDEVMYFPATKILVFSHELCRWYDKGNIDPDCYLQSGEIEYMAYNLNFCDNSLEAIKQLSTNQFQKGQNDVKRKFKELIYVNDK